MSTHWRRNTPNGCPRASGSERDAQRHRGGSARDRLYTNPAEAHPGAPARHVDGLWCVSCVSGLLPDLPFQRGHRLLPEDRPAAVHLPHDFDFTHDPGGDHASAGDHHTAARPADGCGAASSHRALDVSDLDVCECYRGRCVPYVVSVVAGEEYQGDEEYKEWQ